MKLHTIAKWLMIIGAGGLVIKYGSEFYYMDQQKAASLAGATLPAWYQTTIGAVDDVTPVMGTFLWMLLIGGGIITLKKLGGKV